MVSIVEDYCAFMIATMIERCSKIDFTVLPQYSPEAIAILLNQSKDNVMNEFPATKQHEISTKDQFYLLRLAETS